MASPDGGTQSVGCMESGYPDAVGLPTACADDQDGASRRSDESNSGPCYQDFWDTGESRLKVLAVKLSRSSSQSELYAIAKLSGSEIVIG